VLYFKKIKKIKLFLIILHCIVLYCIVLYCIQKNGHFSQFFKFPPKFRNFSNFAPKNYFTTQKIILHGPKKKKKKNLKNSHCIVLYLLYCIVFYSKKWPNFAIFQISAQISPRKKIILHGPKKNTHKNLKKSHCIVLYCIVLYCIVLYPKKWPNFAIFQISAQISPHIKNHITQPKKKKKNHKKSYCIQKIIKKNLKKSNFFFIILHCIVLYCIQKNGQISQFFKFPPKFHHTKKSYYTTKKKKKKI